MTQEKGRESDLSLLKSLVNSPIASVQYLVRDLKISHYLDEQSIHELDYEVLLHTSKADVYFTWQQLPAADGADFFLIYTRKSQFKIPGPWLDAGSLKAGQVFVGKRITGIELVDDQGRSSESSEAESHLLGVRIWLENGKWLEVGAVSRRSERSSIWLPADSVTVSLGEEPLLSGYRTFELPG